MKKKVVKTFKVKDKLEAQKIFSVYSQMIIQAKEEENYELDYEMVEIKKNLFGYKVILYREKYDLSEFEQLQGYSFGK